jgi:hypothetical protein
MLITKKQEKENNKMAKRWYGSIVNRMMEGNSPIEPQVGMGATELMHSDREPYTIVEIKSPRRIIVQADDSKRIDSNGMSESQQYEYTPNPNGSKVELIKTKYGWKQFKGSTRFMIGERNKYYDYSF